MPLHINNWISKAEPDFYTMFIKTWIPFNAWYFAEYNTTSDGEGLRQVKGTSNKIKNRIVSLLRNNDTISLKFRCEIACLHHELVQRTVLNYNRRVSFECIKLDEYFPELKTHHEEGIIYKIIPHKSDGFKVIVIARDGTRTYMDKTFNPHSMRALLLENQYIALPNENMRLIVRRLFDEVNPEKPFNLVFSESRQGALLMSQEMNVWFKDDVDLIAKALIQILYELRCLLFHGLLDPSAVNQPIYEYAFNILNTLIKELKN